MSDEYIRKQDAINIANDWLLDCFKVQKQDRSCGLIRRLEDSPPADVAPVVRCKDCKFYTSMRPDIKAGICDLNVHHMGDDGFCSCGERKGG